MSALSLLVLAAFAVSESPPSAPHPGLRSNLVLRVCDAGEHRQFETAVCDIELKNVGDRPIVVSNATPFSHWDRVESGVTVPAHGVAYLKATVAVKNSVGYAHRFFRLTTDEPGELAKRQADVQVFATTILDQPAPAIDLGNVDLSGAAAAKSLSLSTREDASFRLTSVESKSAYVNAEIIDDGHGVRVSLKSDAPWGPIDERVELKTNSKLQPEVWVALTGVAEGDIVPDANPVLLGLMRTNAKNQFLIRLTSRSKAAFEIGGLALKGFKGTASASACTPAVAECKLITVNVANDQALGRVGGHLDIDLPKYRRTLSIRLGGGMLLSPETPIHDLNEEAEKAKVAEGKAQSDAPAVVKPTVDLKQVLERSVAAEAPPPAGNGPLLKWSVANQNGVYGYIIYRADVENGPPLRISQETIRATDQDGKNSGRYQWRDNSAVSGRAYWYSVGIMRETGERVPLTGMQKIVAK